MKFPQPVEARDNYSCICQPLFRSANIKTKIPNRAERCFKILTVKQEYLNLPRNLRMNISELYEGGRFISEEALENLIRNIEGPPKVIHPITNKDKNEIVF